MSQLMAENERRLKDILRLQEDWYAGILASKADKENVEGLFTNLLPKSEFMEASRKISKISS